QIAATLRTLYTGSIVGQFEDKGHCSDVRVRLSGEQRQSLDDLTGIYLPSNYPTEYGMPAMISLNQLTRISFSSEPQEISRFDRSKEIVLSGNLYGTSLGEFKKVFLKRVNNEVKLPAGYQLVEGGYAEAMTESWQVLVLAMVAGILFIFFVMAAQFESFIDPLAIMFSLPLAIIGAILGLFLVGSDLSLVSMIGIIMLMGLVTKNAILLIDFAKRARATGVPRNEALLQAASVRLRPIMMTSLAMIFGMLPLALALGSGAESRSPMAHAIIGGLITSTMLTLLVVPVVYSLLDDLRNIVAARNAPRGTGGEPPEVRPS
ncbi:MAG: efflux RND transporter permease subunit, partial [Firmicutes bacterium]|nr:efflux RND transporter permease subunit [Bacillota bacterium]